MSIIYLQHSPHFCLSNLLTYTGIVFSGSIVPILNKILVSADPSGSANEFSMPSIVRIEKTGESEQPHAEQQTETETANTDAMNRSRSGVDGCVVPAVGDMVAQAREMLGSCIFRGVITEVRNCIVNCLSTKMLCFLITDHTIFVFQYLSVRKMELDSMLVSLMVALLE